MTQNLNLDFIQVKIGVFSNMLLKLHRYNAALVSATLILFTFLLLSPEQIFAFENQFITLINPVRISSYNQDPLLSIKTEYNEYKKRSLYATWLLTYDILQEKELTDFFNSINGEHEVGLFLEINEGLASDAGVSYNKTDSWHRPNSLFLSGYKQIDRLKLIDKLFEKFKSQFGYYPSSVGSWWTDSYSLDYMQKKYKISGNLGVSDQFSTDGYSIWGQYWSIPFYPSNLHSGIPANKLDNKLNVVNFQWAARDPLLAYGDTNASKYSTQDYFTLGLTEIYLQQLIDTFLDKKQNSFGQITMGVESDLQPDFYVNTFSRYLDVIKGYKDTRKVKTTTMNEFSSWYMNIFPNLSPPHIIESKSTGAQENRAIWYQSPNYRIGLVYDPKKEEVKIRDFRIYNHDFMEPFFESPNKHLVLYINIPSVIDTISDPASEWILKTGNLTDVVMDGSSYNILFSDNRRIVLSEDRAIIENFILKHSPNLNSMVKVKSANNKIELLPISNFYTSTQGIIFRDLSINATYFLNRPKVKILWNICLILLILLSIRLIFTFNRFGLRNKTTLIIVAFSFLSTIFFMINTQMYQVNQSEVDALLHLVPKSWGRILVYDRGCLICIWQTPYPPAIFGNKRDYVEVITKKPYVKDSIIFETNSRREGKERLNNLKIKYIYLTKFESYEEKVPFSPGDYGIKKIYENSNAQIWEVIN